MGYLILGILLLALDISTGFIRKWISLPFDFIALYILGYGFSSVIVDLIYGASIWQGIATTLEAIK
jgi:hypothetical protein